MAPHTSRPAILGTPKFPTVGRNRPAIRGQSLALGPTDSLKLDVRHDSAHQQASTNPSTGLTHQGVWSTGPWLHLPAGQCWLQEPQGSTAKYHGPGSAPTLVPGPPRLSKQTSAPRYPASLHSQRTQDPAHHISEQALAPGPSLTHWSVGTCSGTSWILTMPTSGLPPDSNPQPYNQLYQDLATH